MLPLTAAVHAHILCPCHGRRPGGPLAGETWPAKQPSPISHAAAVPSASAADPRLALERPARLCPPPPADSRSTGPGSSRIAAKVRVRTAAGGSGSGGHRRQHSKVFGSIFKCRTAQGDNVASAEYLPDNQFGPITVFIARGATDGWPIQICFPAPLLLADANCG
jgi:hypothetical protein